MIIVVFGRSNDANKFIRLKNNVSFKLDNQLGKVNVLKLGVIIP